LADFVEEPSRWRLIVIPFWGILDGDRAMMGERLVMQESLF